MDECIPKKCFASKNLRHLIAKKKRLRRAYFRRKFNDPGLKMEINSLDMIIRNAINVRNSDILMNKLKQIRPNTKMYMNISKLLGDGRKVVPELKESDGSLISNPFDKANAIAKVYDEIHKQNRDMGDPNFDAIVISEVISFSQKSSSNLFELRLTDPEEIRRILKDLKNQMDRMLSRMLSWKSFPGLH